MLKRLFITTCLLLPLSPAFAAQQYSGSQVPVTPAHPGQAYAPQNSRHKTYNTSHSRSTSRTASGTASTGHSPAAGADKGAGHSLSEYSLEAFFRNLAPRKPLRTQNRHATAPGTVPRAAGSRAPCPVHQPEEYARYMAVMQQNHGDNGTYDGTRAGNATRDNGTVVIQHSPHVQAFQQSFQRDAYINTPYPVHQGRPGPDAHNSQTGAHGETPGDYGEISTAQGKFYAPVGTIEPKSVHETFDHTTASEKRADIHRYRRMPEEIVQVAFQNGGSGASPGAVAPAADGRNIPYAGVPNLFAANSPESDFPEPGFQESMGLSGSESWENLEVRRNQGNATRLATRPAPVSAPYTASPTAATTASPDLSKPWDLGEFDSDGARIVSAEEAARLGMTGAAGTSPNRTSHSSASRSPGRGGSRTGSAYSRQAPGTATGAKAGASQQKDSVVQGESLVERLAMRSRQNRTTTAETVSRGTSMNTAASQPVGGPGLGAALRDAMPGGSLGKSLAGEFRPSNDRTWSANHAVMPVAEFRDNSVTVRNIRYTSYRTAQDYTARYYDATFNLDEIRSIDVIVAPFTGTPSLAHVEASFGFADGTYIAVSIEGRYEQGESYDPLGGITNQFELIYIVADERDVIRLYTQVNKNEIYLYRLRMTPAEVREIFVSMLNRANKLAQTPEFYHAVSNNCATNLIAHINAGRTDAIPRDYRARFPGLIDRLLFERGLLETTETDFKKVREGSQINWLAEKFGDQDEFSLGIRQQLH